MPLKYFLHPETKEKVLVKDCLEKGILSEYYPLSFLYLCAEERKWKGQPSTTQLISGTRAAYLKIFCDYAMDPDRQTFKLMGTLGHKKLEDYTPACSIAELKIDEGEITGTLDLLEKQPNGKFWLIDNKMSGSYKIKKALGLQEVLIPAFDEKGDPILYKRDGKHGKKGEQKKETIYIRKPNTADMNEWILQLNRYRIEAEKYLKIKISKIKIFAMPRDAGTYIAKSYGITKGTYYIEVPILENKYIDEYFEQKKNLLLDAIDNCNTELKDATKKERLNIIIKNMPKMCSSKGFVNETWDGRKCQNYCDIAEFCKMKNDNPYLRGEQCLK